MLAAPLSLAKQALVANKLRTALTLLGTIIGVTCVVALWNIGESGRLYMQQSLAAFGKNVIFITARWDRGDALAAPHAHPLGMQEILELQQHCPSLSDVSPVRNDGVTATFEASRQSIMLTGCQPSYFSIRGLAVEKGAFFGAADEERGNRVLVLGSGLARQLFGVLDPVGRTVALNRVPFTVIGVLMAKGSSMGIDEDRQAYLPFSSVAGAFGGQAQISQIVASAKPGAAQGQAKREILKVLRFSQQIPDGRADPVWINDMSAMMEIVDRVLIGVTLLLGAIGAISLLVGGIGIMNIMLVSVTERTREIGLRMALGASDFHVLVQFLVEAVVLSRVR